MPFSWESNIVNFNLVEEDERYENALNCLRDCQSAMQTEVGNEQLDRRERECKVMLIDLCKDIALEFAEGVKSV